MTVGRTYEVVIVMHSATSGDLKTTGLSSNITSINALELILLLLLHHLQHLILKEILLVIL